MLAVGDDTFRLSKLSFVVSPFGTTEKHLVYSNTSGACCLVTDEALPLLHQLQDNEQHAYAGSMEVLTQLVEQGIVVPAATDDLALFQRRIDLVKNRSELDLIVNLTLDCNMICPYCFERKRPEYMTVDTAKALVSYVRERCRREPIRKIVLSLFGGEPLLNLSCIKYLLENLRDVASQCDCRLRVALITNGLLLDEDAVSLLEQYDTMLVQVTIDGPRDVHNSRRIVKVQQCDGFEIIMGNIMNLLGRLPLGIRINVDLQNVNQIGELIPYWLELGLNREDVVIDIKRVVTYSDVNVSYRVKCIEERAFDFETVPVALKFQRSGFRTTLSPVRKPRYIHCGANTDKHLAVDPNGSLYTCLTAAGNADLCVGNLFTNPMFNERYREWTSRSPLRIAECVTCPVIGFCGGGCAAEALAQHGRLDAPACPPFKFRFAGPVLIEGVAV